MNRLLKNLSAVILLVTLANCTMAQCKAKQIVKDNKKAIDPYQYDSYAMNEVIIDPAKPQVIEVEFTAFAGQKYKLVFGTSSISEDMKLNVYDKNQRNQKRKKVYDSENGIEKHWVFEPSKSGTYYIDYEIPKSSDGQKKTGCVVMLIGYKE
jgi:hypothetical protein